MILFSECKAKAHVRVFTWKTKSETVDNETRTTESHERQSDVCEASEFELLEMCTTNSETHKN